MTRSATESFTLTNAKYLASKVTVDMRRCQQLYGEPSDAQINDYGTELAIRLQDGYVSAYEFGFIRMSDDERVLTWQYKVDQNGTLLSDDRPGRIIACVDISGTQFGNYLTNSAKWFALDPAARASYIAKLPFERKAAPEYGSQLGSWQYELCYSSGGVALPRRVFKPYGA